MNISSPSFPNGLDDLRTESEARGLSMVDVIKAGATEAVKRAPRDLRTMPTCQWSGMHRYGVVGHDNGLTVEACDFCGRKRAYPDGTSSRHAKPYGSPNLESAGNGRGE